MRRDLIFQFFCVKVIDPRQKNTSLKFKRFLEIKKIKMMKNKDGRVHKNLQVYGNSVPNSFNNVVWLMKFCVMKVFQILCLQMNAAEEIQVQIPVKFETVCKMTCFDVSVEKISKSGMKNLKGLRFWCRSCPAKYR